MHILYCKLRLVSPLSLNEIGEIISNRVLGGVPFVLGAHSIRDEIPAIFAEKEVLGMDVVLMGEPDEEGYYLIMDTRSLLGRLTVEEAKKSFVNISTLVAHLLDGVKEVSIIVEEDANGGKKQ